MTNSTPLVVPVASSLQPERIPELLRREDRWVTWRKGPVQTSGKFSKLPTNRDGRVANCLDPSNWVSFREACAAHERGACDGIGFVLDGAPIQTETGAQLYITALDLDNCEDQVAEMKRIWMRLGKPYREISPSGKGLRMFALSRERLPGGNAGGGRELYSNARFVTVTGVRAGGAICDATEQLAELHAEWFPSKILGKRPLRAGLSRPLLGHLGQPATPAAIARVQDQLFHLSADCHYEKWRAIVWSVLSSGWSCAEQIARDWSQTAPNRYESDSFDTLVRDFDPEEGITLGTLSHHAKEAGWVGPVTKVTPPQSSGCAHSSFSFLTAQEVKALPNLGYRVRGLLPAEGIAAVFGPSGSGKSFLVADLCFAITSGHSDWFGRKVKTAPVVYVALEGTAGLKNRITALEAHYSAGVPNNLRFVLGGLNLMDANGLELFARETLQKQGPGGVVVIDTLNQAAPGADENASQDMGVIIASAKLIAETVRGLVILVHHTGKDGAKGLRGHSSLGAALDAAIEVLHKDGFRSWTATKVKDDAPGGANAFKLKSYTIGTDEDALPVTSCAIERTLVPALPSKGVTGKDQKMAMSLLRRTFDQGDTVIPESRAVEVIGGGLTCAPGRRKTRAREILESLISGGHFSRVEGGIRPP